MSKDLEGKYYLLVAAAESVAQFHPIGPSTQYDEINAALVTLKTCLPPIAPEAKEKL